MSLAISIPGSSLAWKKDYEPATNDSRDLQRAWSNKQNYLWGSALDWLPSVNAALSSIRGDCTHANWDGENALPVAPKALEQANKIAHVLFAMLPKGTPVPDLVPEPDGEIGLGWAVDTEHVFALSIGNHDKINFAGQFGKRGSIHGWRPIDAASDERLAKSLEEVARHINSLYEQSNIE